MTRPNSHQGSTDLQYEVNDFSASKNNPTAQDDDVEMTPGQEESLVEIPCGEPQRVIWRLLILSAS